MGKKKIWLKSAGICLTVIAVMLLSVFSLFGAESNLPMAGSIVDASQPAQSKAPENDEYALAETAGDDGEAGVVSGRDPGKNFQDDHVIVLKTVPEVAKKETEPLIAAAVKEEAAVSSAANETAPKVTESLPLETATEQPEASPSAIEIEAPKLVETQQAAVSSPVTYSFGAAKNSTFRIQVAVTNNGTSASRNVSVSVPMLENNSPYQTTTLKSVNYSIASSSGRLSTFNIGDLAPGETKTIVADFNVSVRPVSINSSNDTVEKARQAYNQYAGSGNCRTLALGFISKCREMGITAREVVGFARPQRGVMTSGSLQGSRHSWAEFYVDGLGWVPVDLTFQYFGSFPQASHVIEGYGDQSIKVNYTGGSLGASWSNSIL
jgi:hypothetical protein